MNINIEQVIRGTFIRRNMKLDLELKPEYQRMINSIVANDKVKRFIITVKELEITTVEGSVHTFPLEGGVNVDGEIEQRTTE